MDQLKELKIDFTKEFNKLKNSYSCVKCQTQDIQIPILLKTCRHIFCTKCLVIQGKQHCPNCNTLYTAMNIDRGNTFVSSIMKEIGNLDKTYPVNKDKSDTSRYMLELDSNNANALAYEQISQVLQLMNQVGNCSEETNIIDVEENQVKSVSKKSKKRSLKQMDSAKKLKSMSTDSTHSNDPLSNSENMLSLQISDNNLAPLPQVDSEFQNVQLCKDKLKRNAKGETQLHLACKKANAELVHQLIDSGMDVNCVDWGNWTPLHEAIQSKDECCTQLLLRAGCLVNIPATNYITPLHLATELKLQSLINSLINYGADPDAPDLAGRTPSDTYASSKSAKRSLKGGNTLVFNCDSSKCGPKATGRAEMQLLEKLTVTNQMEHLTINVKHAQNLFCPKVLMALLKAVPIIKSTDLSRFIKCTDMAWLHLIPDALHAGFKRSLKNRLHRLPRLLDGMNFYIVTQITTIHVKGVAFSKEQIQGLIEIAGGKILKRAPSESTVAFARIKSIPFHAKSSDILRNCAHYIVYDEKSAPCLLYKMTDLRHVSASQLLESMWNFEIAWN